MLYPVISLFSGAMGLDLGLKEAGLEITISQDIDPWCVKTAETNNYKCIPGDIRKLISNDPECRFLLRPSGLSPGEAFAVVGGPPCQPFSTAGKRLGTNDPRGSLFMEFIHAIRVIRPRFFVMENVKGLLSVAIKHKPIKNRDNKHFEPDEMPGSAFEVIKKTFADLGYKIVYGLLDAVHFGVPQFRERLIIIGSRDNENIFLPKPTHFQIHQDPEHRWRTLRDVIADLENNPGPCANFSEDRIKYLRMIPMGGNWRNLPKDLIPIAMGGAYESDGGKAGFYRRLDYDQPSPTLVTSPVQKATMLCHPTQDRPLSVREYARIQQFPDDWKIEGSITDCYRQIGNAVPIGLGKAIGQMLIAVANNTAEIKTRRLRGTSVHQTLREVQQITIEQIVTS
ncbi:MAG: DNA cytosine methyltransferase [Anoxybacillus ayderensis]|nr:DNA cytosine methyltransferase [Anoxybacillus ayderensis]